MLTIYIYMYIGAGYEFPYEYIETISVLIKKRHVTPK